MSEQLTRLAQPFKASLVHKPAQGKHGDYVSHDAVTQKILAVVGPYSFEIVELIRDEQNRVDGCLARLTLTIDGRTVSVVEAGECDNVDQKKTNGERAKHAASDAMKRCAMRLGVGLHLWAGDEYFLFDYLRPKDACVECGHKNESDKPAAEVAARTREDRGEGRNNATATAPSELTRPPQRDTNREGIAQAKATLQGQFGATEQ